MGGAPIMRHPVSLCYPSAFPHGKSLSALEMKFCDTWALPCTNKATFVLGCGYRALLRRIPRAKNVMKISAEGFPVQASAVDDSLLMEAAKQTVDAYISSGMVLGLGTGLASCMAIQYLGQKLQTGILGNILGVPMSSLSAAEAAKVGVPLISFENITKLDFAFDDADLVEESTLAAIIGRRSAKGCESIIKEKAVLKAANDLALIVNEEKYTNKLDGAIPVIVRQENWMQIAEEIDDLFLGDAEVYCGHCGAERSENNQCLIEEYQHIDQ